LNHKTVFCGSLKYCATNTAEIPEIGSPKTLILGPVEVQVIALELR
jgi:hypothetical protein